MRFRTRPIVIEAIQFIGTSENLVELSEFVAQRVLCYDPAKEQIVIETREGDLPASLGDWIIKGAQSECYPCKSGIFELICEAAI